MVGTLAAGLAGKKIFTSKDRYWAEVESIIENVNNILKITKILVKYHLKVPGDKFGEAKLRFLHTLPPVPQPRA